MEPMTEQERYEAARRRVAAMKEFYAHLTVYAVVNTGLFAIDALTPGGAWFFWPLLGWGVGLVAHWASVFGPQRRFGAEWERRKIEQLVARDAAGSERFS